MIYSENGEIRPLNVVVKPGSRLARAYAGRRPAATAAEAAKATAATSGGFRPLPRWDLKEHGGRTIADLVFVNRFLGGATAWTKEDMNNIDNALKAAMTDTGLQSVISQYYQGSITSSALAPDVVDVPAGPRFFKDQAEQLAGQLFLNGVLGDNDPAQCVIDLMLPVGVVLVDGFSPGFQPPPGAEQEHERRKRALIRIDDEASDSHHGLAGFHDSVHVTKDGQDVTVYYAVGVFSEGANGIPMFDNPWENVVATFYHELNEARTDPDVADAIRQNKESDIGWYSDAGNGEIGDLPITEAESGPQPDIESVFQLVKLADGSDVVPVQLMWSNAAHGPAATR